MVSVAGMVLVLPLTPTNTMHNILKRLDIIKNAVAIEFARAVQAIEQYLADCVGLMVYEDKERQGLKLELKLLERRLQQLLSKKMMLTLILKNLIVNTILSLGRLFKKYWA